MCAHSYISQIPHMESIAAHKNNKIKTRPMHCKEGNPCRQLVNWPVSKGPDITVNDSGKNDLLLIMLITSMSPGPLKTAMIK